MELISVQELMFPSDLKNISNKLRSKHYKLFIHNIMQMQKMFVIMKRQAHIASTTSELTQMNLFLWIPQELKM